MVLRNGADVDELLQGILVRDIAGKTYQMPETVDARTQRNMHSLAVPRDYIERSVLLLACMQLATDFVGDLPWRLVDIEAGNRCLEVTRICEAVGA